MSHVASRLRASLAWWCVFLLAAVHRLLVDLLFFMSKPDATPMVTALTRWDASHYEHIIAQGYFRGADHVAFFPLFPLLVKGLLRKVTGHSVPEVGIFLNQVLICAGAATLYQVARHERGGRFAAGVVLLFFASPNQIFFSGFYTEASFFFAAVSAIRAVQTRSLMVALIAGFALGLARPPGILFGCAYGLVGLCSLGRRSAATQLAVAVGAALGLAAFSYHLHTAVGDPLAFIHIQSKWGRSWSLDIFETIRLSLGGPSWAGPTEIWIYRIDALTACFALALLLSIRMGFHQTFLALGTLVPLLSGHCMSFARFFWAYPSSYLVLGERLRRHSYLLIDVAFLLASWSQVLAVRFLEGRWAG